MFDIKKGKGEGRFIAPLPKTFENLPQFTTVINSWLVCWGTFQYCHVTKQINWKIKQATIALLGVDGRHYKGDQDMLEREASLYYRPLLPPGVYLLNIPPDQKGVGDEYAIDKGITGIGFCLQAPSSFLPPIVLLCARH
jgi:hypothetical protein